MPLRTRTIRFQPLPEDVRRALAETMTACATLVPDSQQQQLGNVQIALAEALNNIAEHAFTGLPPRDAGMTLSVRDDALTIEITDHGHALPQHLLQSPHHHDLTGDVADLPEGGFGWMLIHELTFQVLYSRRDGVNRLSLIFDLSGYARKSALPQ